MSILDYPVIATSINIWRNAVFQRLMIRFVVAVHHIVLNLNVQLSRRLAMVRQQDIPRRTDLLLDPALSHGMIRPARRRLSDGQTNPFDYIFGRHPGTELLWQDAQRVVFKHCCRIVATSADHFQMCKSALSTAKLEPVIRSFAFDLQAALGTGDLLQLTKAELKRK